MLRSGVLRILLQFVRRLITFTRPGSRMSFSEMLLILMLHPLNLVLLGTCTSARRTSTNTATPMGALSATLTGDMVEARRRSITQRSAASDLWKLLQLTTMVPCVLQMLSLASTEQPMI